MPKQLSGHPRIGLSVKAAAASATAWALVQPLPGVANDYPYYAPLGAIIAISTTVVGSIRQSVQGVLAILIGAGVASGADLAFGSNIVTLSIVVVVATLLAGWHRLGAMAIWVPLSALYVLIIGRRDPLDYVIGYGGLTTLGAAIGIGVVLLFPPLPLSPAQRRLTRLRERLADQLRNLSDGLLYEQALTAHEWKERRRSILPLVSEMRTTVAHATEARRANLRTGRWRDLADQQYAQARALEQVALMVEDVTNLVTDQEQAERERVALGAALRPRAAQALRTLGDALDSVDGSTADAHLIQEANDALGRLVTTVRETRAKSDDDFFAAASIIMTLRRAIGALAPDQLADLVPSERGDDPD